MARARQKVSRQQIRGVAMLIAIVSIAVLTVVATEFAYNSRVDLQLAANARDELKAQYLAKSGIGVTRLLLRFQRQLNKLPIPNLTGLLGGLTGGTGAAGASAANPLGGGGTMSIQLWKMAHVDCHLIRGMANGGEDLGEDKLPEAPKEEELGEGGFGRFDGCFDTQITDEEEKLNLNKLDATSNSSRPVATRLLDLVSDKRFEFLFEKEDSHHVKADPRDTVVALRDWIDEDDVQSTINPALTGDPFTRGFADESSLYEKYVPRYRPKNARFDTLDELYRVYGVNDAWMAAFKDRLTVYPDINSNLNINTDDPVLLQMAILSVADPIRVDARLRDPVFIDGIIQKIRAAKLMPLLGMSVNDFISLVELAGVPINSTLKQQTSSNLRPIEDKSNTFRIRVTGEAGAVQKTLTAVVRLDDGLGKLVYWKEE